MMMILAVGFLLVCVLTDSVLQVRQAEEADQWSICAETKQQKLIFDLFFQRKRDHAT